MTDPDVKNLRKLVKRTKKRADQKRFQAAMEWNRIVSEHLAHRSPFSEPTRRPSWRDTLRRWVQTEGWM